MKHRRELIVEYNIPNRRDVTRREIAHEGNLRRVLPRETHELPSTFTTIELRKLLSISQLVGQDEDRASPYVCPLKVTMV